MKDVQVLYTEKLKILMREIKDLINRYTMFQNEKTLCNSPV